MAGLSLAERLEALKAPPMEDLDADEEGLIEYIAPNQLIPKPDEALFFSLYTPYIKDPLQFDWFLFRDYQFFMLGTHGYVLNTFDRLSIDRIFFMYLKKIKPRRLAQFNKIAHFCNHIELCVPALYQARIEELIHSSKF